MSVVYWVLTVVASVITLMDWYSYPKGFERDVLWCLDTLVVAGWSALALLSEKKEAR